MVESTAKTDIGLPDMSGLSQEVKVHGLALASNPNYYTNADGSSNAEKMFNIREVMNTPDMDLYSEFDYESFTNMSMPPHVWVACTHFCQLRWVFIDYLIANNLGNPIDNYRKRLVNKAYFVKYKERIHLHNTVVSLKENPRIIN